MRSGGEITYVHLLIWVKRHDVINWMKTGLKKKKEKEKKTEGLHEHNAHLSFIQKVTVDVL